MNKKTVAQVCRDFQWGDQGLMREVQRAVNDQSGFSTRPLLNVKWLRQHKVGSLPMKDLIAVMADCVKTAVSRKCSAAVYPINIAADGTMFLPPNETVVQSLDSLDLVTNWGSSRLGVSVTCDRITPLGFIVAVGPFFELSREVQQAVDKMKGSQQPKAE